MSKKGTNWTEADLIQKGLTQFEDNLYSNHVKTPLGKDAAVNAPTGYEVHRFKEDPIKKKSKYNNKKVVINGLKFDSTKEGNRYLELAQKLRDGEIFQLELQPVYECTINGLLICKYKADFKYNIRGEMTGYINNPYADKRPTYKIITIVEDVKGMRTPVYKLKKKLMKAIFNIEILET